MPPWGTRADLGPPSVPGAAQVGTWRTQGCGRSRQGGGLARAAGRGLSPMGQWAGLPPASPRSVLSTSSAPVCPLLRPPSSVLTDSPCAQHQGAFFPHFVLTCPRLWVLQSGVQSGSLTNPCRAHGRPLETPLHPPPALGALRGRGTWDEILPAWGILQAREGKGSHAVSCSGSLGPSVGCRATLIAQSPASSMPIPQPEASLWF